MNTLLEKKLTAYLVLAVLLLAAAASGNDQIDESLTVIREFFVGKQKEISKENINAEADPGCESLAWLAELQSNEQMRLNDKKAWSFYFPNLWHAWRRGQNGIPGAEKCRDEKLFLAFLRIYSLPKFSEANNFIDDIICTGFDKRIVEKYAEPLMQRYLVGRVDAKYMFDYRIPKSFVAHFPGIFMRQFETNRRELKQCKAPSTGDKYRLLRFNAYYGELAAQQELISLFASCPGDAKFVSEFNLLMGFMFVMASKESLIAVLSRFPEEIGAPDFDVSGYKRESPRYSILCGFKRLYPRDPFFVKYQHWLRDFGGVGMDAEIGGEKGVQKLFDEFKAWAKEKFGYEMDLSKSTPHINLQRLMFE